MQTTPGVHSQLHVPESLETVALALIGVLSATILLKVAGIQYLEVLEGLLLGITGLHFLHAGLAISLSRNMYHLLAWYFALICLLAFGSGVALTRPFYLDAYGINQPGYISLARLTELVLGVFATVLLTEVFRKSPAKCLFMAKVYFVTGTVSAALSIAGFVLRGPLSIFLSDKRASGFYNEGGPYGLYLVSVILVGIVFLQIRSLRTAWLYAALSVNAIAVVLSASKAAYIAIALLLLTEVLTAGSHRRRVVSMTVLVVALGVLLLFTNVSRGVNGYIQGGRRFEALSQLRPHDTNFSYGRTAAVFFVPRMVAEHPWLGVGFANYGLVRNAPEYRGGAAAATFIDHDGLGLLGLVAETGVPAMLLLLYLLFRPASLTRQLTHWKSILALALMQPLAHLCGAQLNVTYTWVTSALALGFAAMPETQSPPAQHVFVADVASGPFRQSAMAYSNAERL